MKNEKEIDKIAVLEKDIIGYLNQIDTSNSNLLFHEFRKHVEEDEDTYNEGYYTLTLYGGLNNGNGKLLFYMEDIEKLIKKLMIRFTDVWLIEWTNDCADDVFDITLGLRL